MSNKTQLQTNNDELDALIARVNAAKNIAASLPEAGGGGGSELICFIISLSTDYGVYCENVNSFITEKNMTWQEWMESAYNTIGVFDSEGYPSIEGEMMGMQVVKPIVVNEDQYSPVYSSDLIVNNGKYVAN